MEMLVKDWKEFKWGSMSGSDRIWEVKRKDEEFRYVLVMGVGAKIRITPSSQSRDDKDSYRTHIYDLHDPNSLPALRQFMNDFFDRKAE
jgi:hypothetical protein